MTRWVGLLYSVVLTADRRVTKADLLAVAAAAEIAGARTALSTGNLIFDDTADEVTLEHRLERAAALVLGAPIPVFVRSAADLRAVLVRVPQGMETVDPACVGIRFMRRATPESAAARIAAKMTGGEQFVANGRELWVATPGNLSGSALFRAAGAAWAGAGTFRSLSSLRKIAAAMEAG